MSKKFIPTQHDRTMVEAMAGYGIPEIDIARVINNPETKRPITPPTLRRAFREELNTGHVKATAKVAESLFKQATKGHVTAAIFWLKTRARWKETQRHEHTGRDGGPISIDVSKLTDEQLEHVAKHGQLPAGGGGES